MIRTTVAVTLLAVALGSASWAAGAPANLISEAIAVSASSSASGAADTKYGVARLHDSDRNTHWASGSPLSLPETVRVEWQQPVSFDTVAVDIFGKQAANIYAMWKLAELVLDNGQSVRRELAPDQTFLRIRFDAAQTVSWAELRVLDVHELKHYVGINELGFYLDPNERIAPPRQVASARKTDELAPQGRAAHPTVYVTRQDVERARRNAEQTNWGRTARDGILADAERWLGHDPDYWLQFLPEPGACYAYGFTACPLCYASCGTWGGARCTWDRPRTVKCAKGHLLPDAEHPDDGTGYTGADGRVHYLIGTWNAWVTEQWTRHALPSLAHAYALTGDEKYAERAALFFDALASIYAESTSGSWDYPSSPPSGRFARPWYQVARTLVEYVDAYDLIYSSSALDRPSLRPRLAAGFPDGPTAQKRAVGTRDAKGRSWAGMTRRENIDTNLMLDAAAYCYTKTFKGALHNGHADYMRGALAVGALLGVREYVHNAVASPFSIYAMLANNCDRDGRYYETALGYALHARNLYLTFVEPLRNWRCETYPQGVDLFADPRMRSFFYLPDSVMQTAGHSPNFGDCGPDDRFKLQAAVPFSAQDYDYAERLYAGCSGPAKDEFRGILQFLAKGDVAKARAGSRLRRWLLYHADPLTVEGQAELPLDLERRIFGSWLLGQKGIGILRDGREADAQAALLRFGPSLNHGDLDDLGLLYYGKGWQLTYEIGYGLASTHTQVGWGSQTASHALVTVNETSQKGPGSGGSAYLFASLPSVKVMSADSPLSYASQGVSQYHRTVALVGAGDDQVLVDIFRVTGGRQHDYGIGLQTLDATPVGLEFGPEEEGSLAGLEHAWGEKQGPDADIVGYPNRPYWNPPPGNGYGFFYDARRVAAAAPFVVDFQLGGRNDCHLRVHALPEPGTEAILAKAPGLYPRNRKATYLVCRRRGDPDGRLASQFVAVMEPYAAKVPAGGVPCQELLGLVTDSRGEVKLIPGLDVVLLKGTQAGDFMTFALQVPADGDYEVASSILKAPSYGTVRVHVDGQPEAEPVVATDVAISGPIRVSFGKHRLGRGVHQFRFEMLPADAFYVGISSISLLPWEQRPDAVVREPTPILAGVERVAVTGAGGQLAPVGVHIRRQGRDEYVFSTDLTDEVHRAESAAGPITWRGAFVAVACRDGQVAAVATHGAWDVSIGARRYGPDKGIWRGTVTDLNYEERWIELDADLPADLHAECVYFSNPKYSRNTAYRIYGTRRTARGARLELGPQPLLLGQGRVLQVTLEGDILSDIPHDYCRSKVGGSNPRFFDGKLLTNERGTKTNLQTMTYGSPMKLEVESADDFRDGDVLFYYDVQIGDAVTIPTAWELGRD